MGAPGGSAARLLGVLPVTMAPPPGLVRMRRRKSAWYINFVVHPTRHEARELTTKFPSRETNHNPQPRRCHPQAGNAGIT